MSQWISVHDQTPPCDEEVIVYIDPKSANKEAVWIAGATYGEPSEILKFKKIKALLADENDKKEKESTEYDSRKWCWSLPFKRIDGCEYVFLSAAITHWAPFPIKQN